MKLEHWIVVFMLALCPASVSLATVNVNFLSDTNTVLDHLGLKLGYEKLMLVFWSVNATNDFNPSNPLVAGGDDIYLGALNSTAGNKTPGRLIGSASYDATKSPWNLAEDHFVGGHVYVVVYDLSYTTNEPPVIPANAYYGIGPISNPLVDVFAGVNNYGSLIETLRTDQGGPILLSLSQIGSGQVTVNGTPRTLPWDDSFTNGAAVNLNATPANGWRFVNWSGSYSSTNSAFAFTMGSVNVSLLAFFAEIPVPKPDLSGTISLNTNALMWGDAFSATATVVNAGQATAIASTASFYLSADTSISQADHFLGSWNVPLLTTNANLELVQAMTLPTNPPNGFTWNDNAYVGVVFDSGSSVDESNEGNNRAYAALAITYEVQPVGSCMAVRTVSGTNIAIAVTVSNSVNSFSVQETLPSGLTPTAISHNGVWEQLQRTINWGAWTDSQPRTLSYKVYGAPGDYTLSGLCAWDGTNAVVAGDYLVGIAASTSSPPASASQAHLLLLLE